MGHLVGQQSEEEEKRQESFVHLSFRSRSRTQDPAAYIYDAPERKTPTVNCWNLAGRGRLLIFFPIQENKGKTFPFFPLNNHFFFNPIGTYTV
jgi:hypothetical protein